MEKLIPKKNAADSSFFNLLSDAEAIQVREVNSQNARAILSSIERAVQEFESAPHSDSADRAFLVQIKAQKPPVEEVAACLAEAPASREHVLHCASVLLESGDALLARNLYSFLLKEDEHDALALKGLGVCFLRLSDTVSAKKCFQALWDMHSIPDALVWLGTCYVAEKKDDIALNLFKKITEPNSLSPAERFEWHKEIGNCLTRRNLLKEAELHYERANEIMPQSDTIQVNLGTLEIQRQNWEVARTRFDRAIALNTRNAKAHCGLGLVALSRNDLQGALRHFSTTLELDSQNMVALFQLLTLAHLTDDYRGIKNRLVKFLMGDPRNTEVRFALASLLFKEGDWLDCEKEINFILQTEPVHPRAQKLKEELSSNRHRS